MKKRTPIFCKSVVVDAGDLPEDVDAWLIHQNISTHYEESLNRFWREDTDKNNPLFVWLAKCGVDVEDFSDKNVYYISIVGT